MKSNQPKDKPSLFTAEEIAEVNAYWEGLTPLQKLLHRSSFQARESAYEYLTALLKSLATECESGYIAFYFAKVEEGDGAGFCVDITAGRGKKIMPLSDFKTFFASYAQTKKGGQA